jgi:hypothetical protein
LRKSQDFKLKADGWMGCRKFELLRVLMLKENEVKGVGSKCFLYKVNGLFPFMLLLSWK